MKAIRIIAVLASLAALPGTVNAGTALEYESHWLGPADAAGRRPLAFPVSIQGVPPGCTWRIESLPKGIRVHNVPWTYDSETGPVAGVTRYLVGWAKGSFDFDIVHDPCQPPWFGNEPPLRRRVSRGVFVPLSTNYVTSYHYLTSYSGWGFVAGIEKILGPRYPEWK